MLWTRPSARRLVWILLLATASMVLAAAPATAAPPAVKKPSPPTTAQWWQQVVALTGDGLNRCDIGTDDVVFLTGTTSSPGDEVLHRQFTPIDPHPAHQR